MESKSDSRKKFTAILLVVIISTAFISYQVGAAIANILNGEGGGELTLADLLRLAQGVMPGSSSPANVDVNVNLDIEGEDIREAVSALSDLFAEEASNSSSLAWDIQWEAQQIEWKTNELVFLMENLLLVKAVVIELEATLESAVLVTEYNGLLEKKIDDELWKVENLLDDIKYSLWPYYGLPMLADLAGELEKLEIKLDVLNETMTPEELAYQKYALMETKTYVALAKKNFDLFNWTVPETLWDINDEWVGGGLVELPILDKIQLLNETIWGYNKQYWLDEAENIEVKLQNIKTQVGLFSDPCASLLEDIELKVDSILDAIPVVIPTISPFIETVTVLLPLPWYNRIDATEQRLEGVAYIGIMWGAHYVPRTMPPHRIQLYVSFQPRDSAGNAIGGPQWSLLVDTEINPYHSYGTYSSFNVFPIPSVENAANHIMIMVRIINATGGTAAELTIDQYVPSVTP